MTATETTTVPTNPAEVAAQDIWQPKLIADTSISDGILPKLIDGGIETFGELDTETLHGDAPARLKKLKLNDVQIAELMDLLKKAKEEAIEEVNDEGRSRRTQPLPKPTEGEKGYERKFKASVGKVSVGKGKVSCSIKVPIAGESGHAGYRRDMIERYFINAQLDAEISTGQQLELNGKRPFHAVGTTKRVSFGEKDASFTMSFERNAIDVLGLAAYADFECQLAVNLNSGPGLDEDDDDQDES